MYVYIVNIVPILFFFLNVWVSVFILCVIVSFVILCELLSGCGPASQMFKLWIFGFKVIENISYWRYNFNQDGLILIFFNNNIVFASKVPSSNIYNIKKKLYTWFK